MCQFLRLKTKMFLSVSIPCVCLPDYIPLPLSKRSHSPKFVILPFVFNLNLKANISVFNVILT